MTSLKQLSFIGIALLALSSTALAEDKVYECDPAKGHFEVEVRTKDLRNCSMINKAHKITLGEHYVVIETKKVVYSYPREAVTRLRWTMGKASMAKVSEVKKAPAKTKKVEVAKKAKPRVYPKSPQDALADCIALLKKKEYVQFVKDYLHPKDYERMEKEIGLKALIEGFKGAKANELLSVLEGLNQKGAVLDKSGKVVTFRHKDGGSFELHLVGKRWYLKN